jgi:hypothetical protein
MTSSTEEAFDACGLTRRSHLIETGFVAADHLPFQPRIVERGTFEMETP